MTLTGSLANAMDRNIDINARPDNLSSIITKFALESRLDTLKKQQAFIITMNAFNNLAQEASGLALGVALDKGKLDASQSEHNWDIVYKSMGEIADCTKALNTAAGYELEIFGNDLARPDLTQIVEEASNRALDPDDIQISFEIITQAVLEQLSPMAPALLHAMYPEALAQLSELSNDLEDAFWGPWQRLREMALMTWPRDIKIFLEYFLNAPDFMIVGKEKCSILLRAAPNNNCTMAIIPGASNMALPMGHLSSWPLLQRITLLDWPPHVKIFLEPWFNAIRAVGIN